MCRNSLASPRAFKAKALTLESSADVLFPHAPKGGVIAFLLNSFPAVALLAVPQLLLGSVTASLKKEISIFY